MALRCAEEADEEARLAESWISARRRATKDRSPESETAARLAFERYRGYLLRTTLRVDVA